MNPPVDIAVLSNEPTPYRLHMLRRLRDELPAVRVHNFFTHRLHDAHVPWALRVEESLNPVFFEALSLSGFERHPLRCDRAFRRLRDELRSRGVRLIILLGYFDLARLRLIAWARRAGVPLLLHVDSNVYGESRLSPIKRAAKKRLVRWVVGQVAGLMPMGRCGRAFFATYAPGHEKPVFLHPYEPDYAELTRRDEAALRRFMQAQQLDPSRRRILSCGRLVPHKGVADLIDAFAPMAAQRPEWDLLIAGDGPMRRELESRVPASLRHRVRFTGFLQFEQTRLCYHCSEVLAHLSRYEPWGLVINEAVASGLAVAASDVTGAAVELVEPGVNGLWVTAGEVPAWTAALLEITQPATLQAMRLASAAQLQRWRSAADPVQGVRAALRHFKLSVD